MINESWIGLPETGQTVIYSSEDDGDLKQGVIWPEQRFIDNDDGTITDNLTGLIWEQSPLSPAGTWQTALAYASNSTFAGYDDWRLPNILELESLLNHGESNSAAWLNLPEQGFINFQSDEYWSSTTFKFLDTTAYYIVPYNGDVRYNFKTESYNIIAVRGGK